MSQSQENQDTKDLTMIQADSALIVDTVSVDSLEKEEVISTLLTAAKERELLTLIQESKSQAIKDKATIEMVEANTRLVIHTARKFHKSNSSMSLDDLISAGKVGLIRAIQRFDLKLENKFSTYAMSWIKQGMYEMMNQSHVVSMPPHIINQMLKYNKKTDIMDEDEADEIIVSELDITGKALSKIKMAKVSKVSLDESVNDGENKTTYGDIIEDVNALTPYDIMNKQEQIEIMMEVVSRLDEQKKDIIMAQCFCAPEDKINLSQLGDKYGVSAERIRQIKEETLNWIREEIEEMV